MKIFNKQYIDILSTSPGNYIFQNKCHKSEFGKISSLIYILLSILFLIYYLYSYFLGKEMNVTYFKKTIRGIDHSDSEIYEEKNEYENDNFVSYSDGKKKYYIKIFSSNGAEIDDKENLYVTIFNGQYISYKLNDCYIEFEANNVFYLWINKTKEFSNDTLNFWFTYKTSHIRNENKVPLKENKNYDSLNLVVYPKLFNQFTLNKYYIEYRDGIRLKNFFSYLFFWTHYETIYEDFYYNNYFYISSDLNSDTLNNNLTNFVFIDNENFEATGFSDFYQRKYESFLSVLAKWCGIFSSLKILFFNLTNFYSFSFNNYELVKYINKKYDNNNYIIYLNKNNNNNNNEIKNIDKNNINDNISKEFNKIKTFDIIKYSFCCCCNRKSKTNKILKHCNSYVLKYISIENIFYNMLVLETIIENYKLKENYELQKFEEMKNKINLYEIEINNLKNKNNPKIEHLNELTINFDSSTLYKIK